MSFNDLMQPVNQAVVAVLGEPCTVTVGRINTTINGVFSLPVTDQSMGGFGIRETMPTVAFQSTDFIDTGAQENDTVTIRGIDYTITRPPEHDGAGMVMLTLRNLDD